MKVKVTRGTEKTSKYGRITRIQMPDKSKIYISKKGWNLVTPDGKEISMPFSEINVAIQETMIAGYIHGTTERESREIKIPFNPWSKKRLSIHKTSTSRGKIYGLPGDWFVVGERTYVIEKVEYLPVEFIINHLYYPEGAESPEELRRVLNGVFRGKSLPEYLYTHFFSVSIGDGNSIKKKAQKNR